MIVKHESNIRGARKAYTAPTVTWWGKVADLTMGPTGPCDDGVSGGSGNQSCG